MDLSWRWRSREPELRNVAGNDLRAWADLMRYAGAITTRRQFLPTPIPSQNTPAPPQSVAIRETNYESRWVPARPSQPAA